MDTTTLKGTIEPRAAGLFPFVVVLESGGTIVTELEVPSEEAGRLVLENLSDLLGTNLVPPALANGLVARH